MEESIIILAVCGGIASYKMPSLASAFKKYGYRVHVMQTPNSKEFVTPASLEAMSDVYFNHSWGRPMHIEVTEHLSIKDAFVVVPATATTIAKIVHGIGDNLVTDTALALNDDVVKIVCPAMNLRMWNNVAVQDNIKTLIDRGWHVIQPVEGILACGTKGKGKLAGTRELVDDIRKIMFDCRLRAFGAAGVVEGGLT